MAEDEIVQTIRIEVEGDTAEEALGKIGEKAQSSFEELQKAAETAGVSIEDFGRLSEKTQEQYVELSQRVEQASQQMVQSTQEVQQAAGQAGSGTKDLGGGLDQVSQKSGISSREMRGLSKIMREFGAGDLAGTAFTFYKIASSLGGIGIAALAAAEAFSYIKGKMKEAEEQAKATTKTMAEIARVFAEIHPEREGGWGATAAGMKEVANNADLVADQLESIKKGSKETISALTSQDTLTKAFVTNLESAGISINDVAADTTKLGVESQKAALEAAKIYEKMSPIEKLNFEKVLKGLFPEDVVKNIEKGPEALKKSQEEAVKYDKAVKELTTSLGRLGKAYEATTFAPKPVASSGEGLQNLVKDLKTLGKFEHDVVDFFSTLPEKIKSGFGDAWQWLVEAAASAWEQVKTLAQQAKDAVVQFVTTAPGNAWQWIKDTAASVWEQVKTGAQQAWDAVVKFVTTPVANAWQWIKDTWNANVPKFMQIGGGAPAGSTAGGGAAPGGASGGLFVGRNGGTDTNLAWLTTGEFVMNTAAVRKYGTAMMHAINSLQAPRFAMGGLNIGRPSLGSIGAFAGGGMNNVTINFPGLPEITGLRASSGVVSELQRAAALAQVRSGGRKPSRYG